MKNRITIVCDVSEHRRDLARFERTDEGDWEALKGGSWEIETRGTDVISETTDTSPTGTRYRTKQMRPPRDRWRIWCPACERQGSRALVITAIKLADAISKMEAEGTQTVTLDTLRGEASKQV